MTQSETARMRAAWHEGLLALAPGPMCAYAEVWARPFAAPTGARLAGQGGYYVANGVAHVPIQGCLDSLAYGRVVEAVTAAQTDSSAKAILLRVNSPGGSTRGLPEAADALRRRVGATRVPVHAHVEGLGASAAYWLAAQAQRVTVTLSGLVGSVGILSIHEDISLMLERMGVRLSEIARPESKLAGSPLRPLDEGARRNVQARIDYLYELFARSIAAARGVSEDLIEEMWGEVYTPPLALSLGMVDAIETLDQVVAGLRGDDAARLATARAHLDLRMRRARVGCAVRHSEGLDTQGIMGKVRSSVLVGQANPVEAKSNADVK